jgi:hypothetical protein
MTTKPYPGSIQDLEGQLARLRQEHDRQEAMFVGLRGQTTDDTVLTLALQLSAVRIQLAEVYALLAAAYAATAVAPVRQAGREIPRLGSQ